MQPQIEFGRNLAAVFNICNVMTLLLRELIAHCVIKSREKSLHKYTPCCTISYNYESCHKKALVPVYTRVQQFPCIERYLRPFKINCMVWVTSLVPFTVSVRKTHKIKLFPGLLFFSDRRTVQEKLQDESAKLKIKQPWP